jgi:transposase InsO family protein
VYSYEDRIRAVELYIKLGKRVRPTIRQLGYRRLQASLTRQDVAISEKVVQRLMKQESLVVPKPRKRRYASYLGEISPAPENLINRDFQAAVPNEK